MPSVFRRILVPHDFSTHATKALATAAALAGRGGRLTVLHAITPFMPVSGFPVAEEMAWIPPADLLRDAGRRLEQLVARTVSGRGAPKVSCQAVMGEPVQRILAAARGHDSVVMSTAGRTGLSHLLIGSVAERVVRHASVPVLTLRPAAARAVRRARRARRAKR